MKFTKEEYEKLTARFNALPFTDQIQRVIDNPEILEMKVAFYFKGVDYDNEEIQKLKSNS